jgi:hypothetical protein
MFKKGNAEFPVGLNFLDGSSFVCAAGRSGGCQGISNKIGPNPKYYNKSWRFITGDWKPDPDG